MYRPTRKTAPPKTDNRDAFEKAADRAKGIFNTVRDAALKKESAGGDEFFRAVRLNKPAEVARLINAGFDPNMHDKNGNTALHLAARANQGDLVALLLEKGADPKRKCTGDMATRPVEDAVRFGAAQAIEVLVRHGGYVMERNEEGWSLLHLAAEKGKDDVIKALLHAGADANVRTHNGSTPLLIAVARKQTAAALALLNDKAAVAGINLAHTDGDARKRNAFHVAVERGDVEVVSRMADLGAFVNAADASGMTALMIAAENTDKEMMSLLLQKGADPRLCDLHGRTALHILAAQRMAGGRIKGELAELLVACGADPDARTRQGDTALHILVEKPFGDDAILRLHHLGARLDVQNNKGETPMMRAQQTGQGGNALALQECIPPLANTRVKEAIRQPKGPAP